MPMQAARHKAVWLRMLAVKEIRFARDSKALLKKQAREIGAAFKSGGHSKAESVIINGEKDWVRVLVANYAVIIRDFASYLLTQLNSKSDKAFSDLAQGFIARGAAQKAKNLTQTTKDDLARVILQAEQDGVGTEVAAKAITTSMQGIAITRARTIARTETAGAANYAMYAQASDIDFKVNKVWVAVDDDRTRPTHTFVDGTEIGFDEYFDVGGERLLYPGDPDADPSEIVNCRCTLIYEPVGNIFSEDNIE